MISVVIPAYNETQVLPELSRRLAAAAAQWGESYEVIFVDDGSTDETWESIRGLCRRDLRWKAIRLGRNFGHQAAISAGLAFAGGDVVVIMDADLQDPPELIKDFLEQWRAGYEVVYAIRKTRKESIIKRIAFKLFYKTLDLLANVHIPADAGDFCLMDRKIVDILKAMPERNRFVRGLRSWAGFRQTGVPYERPSRRAGDVKYTYRRLFGLAFDGILSFTALPLRMATVIGLSASFLSMLAAFFYFLTRVLHQLFEQIGFPLVPGFATTIIVIFFLGGVQLTFLGILGEYVARIYDEVKARPIWTTMELVGFRDETGHPTDSVYCLKSRPESLNLDTLESLRQTQSRDPSGNRRG